MKRLFSIILILCAQLLPLPSSAQEQNESLSALKIETSSGEIANVDFSESKDSSIPHNENELLNEEKNKEEKASFYVMAGGGYGILAGKYSARALNVGLRYEGPSKGLDISYLTITHSWATQKETISVVPFFKYLFYDKVKVFTGIGPAVSKARFKFFFLEPTERYYSLDASASFQCTYLLKYKFLQGVGVAINAIQPVYFLNKTDLDLYKTYYPSTTYSLLLDF